MKNWKTLVLVAVAAVAITATPAFAGHRVVKHRRQVVRYGWGPSVYVPAPQVYVPPVVVRPRPIYDYPGYYVPPVHGHYYHGYGWQSGGIGVHTSNFGLHIRF